jgi:hypothetical protein
LTRIFRVGRYRWYIEFLQEQAMYTDLNPYVWRWLILAGFLAFVGLGLALVATGQWLQRRALARRRAERMRRPPAHAHRVGAG